MAIGTPVQLGSALLASGNPVVLTTGAASAAGSLIVGVAEQDLNSSVTSVTDSAGNTYTLGNNLSSGSTGLRAFWCVGAKALGSGGTISATFNATGGAKVISAISIPGAAAVDKQPAQRISVGTGPSIATGVLTVANEIVIGFIWVISGSADAFTEAGGFTGNNNADNGTSILHWAYQIVSSTSSVTYAPTLGTSRTYFLNVLSFVEADVLRPQSMF